MADITCNNCIHKELCDVYASFGVTDVPADDITPCKLFKSADVVEVVHGEWKETTQPLGFEEVKCATCSVCDEDWIMDEDVCIDDYKTHWKYCPACGAKMDGERKCEE